MSEIYDQRESLHDAQAWLKTVSVSDVVWKTADGRQLTMSEISDKHLENIVNRLKSRLAQFEQEYKRRRLDEPDKSLGVYDAHEWFSEPEPGDILYR